MKKPRFSIIVPLFNKAPYIRKALESILSQTYKEWELIIVDDGSTDESLQIVEDFIQCKVESVKCKVISQANAGVAVARNRGVMESRGEYMCFLDADDWWEKEYLEEMAHLIEAYPDAGLYGCDYYYVKKGRMKIFPKNKEGYIDYCQVYTDCKVMPIHPNGAIIPRKVFDEVGGFDPQIKMGEDFILFMQIVMRYKVAFLNKQLVYFNQDADPKWRAITKLHKPEHHMLWHVSQWERDEKTNVTYKQMIDWLRVEGLMKYWMDKQYHDVAGEELKKVDWNKQSKSAVRKYKMPLTITRCHKFIMTIGSYFKQKLLKLFR